jgi:hypothetical protein
MNLNETYLSIDRTPYTYLIGWTKYQKYYYGRRTAKFCHPSELWKKYFTSSRHVKNFFQQFGNPDIITIRKQFKSTKKACEWESKVLRRINAKYNDKMINKTNGDAKWDTTCNSDCYFKHTGQTHVTMRNVKTKKCQRLLKDDVRIIRGEFVGVTAGIKSKHQSTLKLTCTVKDEQGKTYRVHKDHPLIKTGELKGVTFGLSCYKDKNGIKLMLSKNDERVKSGEFINVNKGKIGNGEKSKRPLVIKIKSLLTSLNKEEKSDLQLKSGWYQLDESKLKFILYEIEYLFFQRTYLISSSIK